MIRLVAGHGEAATFSLAFMLEELGLPFDLQRIDLSLFGQWSAEHRALSPDGSPVVLEMDGRVMDDPLLALLYLAETTPEAGLLPVDPADRYLVQTMAARLYRQVGENIRYLGWLATTSLSDRADYMRRLTARPDRPVLAGWSAVWRDAVPEDQRPDDARAKIRQGVDQVVTQLDGRQWLVSDHFTIADIVATALLWQAPNVEPTLAHRQYDAALASWFERVCQRPAARRARTRIADAGLNGLFCPPIFA